MLSPGSVSPPRTQRQRIRQDAESPGYTELPVTPPPRRRRQWFRSVNATLPYRLRSPWLLILPLGILLFLAVKLFFTRPGNTSDVAESVAATAVAVVEPPSFERLRGKQKLFIQYEEKGQAIDRVVASKPIAPSVNVEGNVVPLDVTIAKKKVEAVVAPPEATAIIVLEAVQITKKAPATEIKEPEAVVQTIQELPQRLLPALTVAKEYNYTHDEAYYLKWRFNFDEKDMPAVGNEATLRRLFPKEPLAVERTAYEAKEFDKKYSFVGSRHISDLYYNALAVFPGVDASHPHGRLGVTLNGEVRYKPKPMPPRAEDVPGGLDAALENGGFYLPLSDALPLERDTLDSRESICKEQVYDSAILGDASVVITYYNEPFSTLMRSVHSVLNQTPPELLREIILVDDHSALGGCEAGSSVDDYVRLLPKVKLMHLGERRGIVTARLAGIKMATAPSIVLLDSHIELNKGWLEPQLQRLVESPKSLVFPQILSIDSTDFHYNTESGIGTFLSFKWMMQERPFAPHAATTIDAIPSPSMAGGLFAIRRDWFYEVGAFDEEFEMWGAENVEFALRVWQCGGRVEGIPCAKTYHIYRSKGMGYKSPSDSLLKNRLRTARLWLDDYYQMAKQFVAKDADTRNIGSFDKILALKEKLKCKNFQWYLDNVATNKQPRHIADIGLLGDIRNIEFERLCVDTMQGNEGDAIGIYPCHGLGGSQAFMTFDNNPFLMLGGDETHCVSPELKQRTDCDRVDQADHAWRIFFDTGRLELEQNGKSRCLGIRKIEGKPDLVLDDCQDGAQNQQWVFTKFVREENFELPTESEERIAFKQRRDEWNRSL